LADAMTDASEISRVGPASHGSVALPVIALVVSAILRAGVILPANAGAAAEFAMSAVAIALLVPTVLVALRHAESIADRIGEPFGTLVLTLAVTTIEVAIIVSMMLHGANNPTLARESIFSVVMIVCSGGVGLCLTAGALKHREQDHKPQATNAYLAVLMALSVLSLMLPNYTLSTGPGTYSSAQLLFVSVLSALLYAAFLYIQSVRHRGYFVDDHAPASASSVDTGARMSTWTHVLALLAGLVAVVLLAEKVAAGVEVGLESLGVLRPDAIVGALVAMLLLFPELMSAFRAARANQLQRSLNVVLGSALATIGLTIPAVAAASFFAGRELVLGLSGRDEVLLTLALVLSVVSFGTGRTNVLNGLVHLVLFAVYLLFLAVP
jgi:Ca2+:H+ antiporter